MAGFGFTEAQEMFRREVRNFAQKELAPGAKERAKLDHLPKEITKKAADVGLLGINIPEKYGGEPADYVSVGIASEELAKVDLALATRVTHGQVAFLWLQHSSEELRQEWIPQIVAGEKSLCYGGTEPDFGSDAAGTKTRATKDGDSYIISGEKTCISNGMQADISVVLANADPAAGARGLSCFLVPLDLPGVNRSHLPHSGFKPTTDASLIYDDVRIPASYRLGEEGKGFSLIFREFNFTRVLLSLMPLGAAQTSLEEAMDYAKQRIAFGRPIAKFEGISFKIAEHATLIEAARLLCYRTLYLRDQGLPHVKEAAMVKWFSPMVAFNAVHDAILIHGHIGYSEEHPLEQRLRDVMGFEYADGTAEIMKIIIARELMGREFQPY